LIREEERFGFFPFLSDAAIHGDRGNWLIAKRLQFSAKPDMFQSVRNAVNA
jgi:hypothetical protein